MYSSLLERYNKRMEGWKTKNLSLAGRVTLATLVVASLPTYHMQMTIIPKPVVKAIYKHTRICVWGSTEEKSNSFGELGDYLQTETRRFGLKRAVVMNKAMLARMGWRLIPESDSLWSKLLRKK